MGDYFRKFIDSIISYIGNDNQGGAREDRVTVEDISQMINDYSSSDIKVFLKKIWLAQYHRWIVDNCNGGTITQMDELLKAESDWETL